MKNILLVILIIVLVVLFGTWPLSILAKVFEYLAIADDLGYDTDKLVWVEHDEY